MPFFTRRLRAATFSFALVAALATAPALAAPRSVMAPFGPGDDASALTLPPIANAPALLGARLVAMGTWSSGHFQAADSALVKGVDPTSASNVLLPAVPTSTTIRSLAQKLGDYTNARDFGAACDGVVNASTGQVSSPTNADDTLALQNMANYTVGPLLIPGICLVKGAIALNNSRTILYAAPHSGNGLASTFAGTLVNINGTNIEVNGFTTYHNVAPTGADVVLNPGASFITIRNADFIDPHLAIQALGGTASTVNILDNRADFIHFVPTPGSGVVSINASTDINIRGLDSLTAFVNGALNVPDFGIEVLAAGDVAIETSGLALFKRGLYAHPGPGQTIVSMRAFKTFFDTAEIAGVDLFANGGIIGRTDFVQTWTSSAGLNSKGQAQGGTLSAGTGLLAHTANIPAGSTNSDGTMCPPGGSACQGQVVGLDLIDHEALGNGGHGVDLQDYYVSNVHIFGGNFSGNVGSGTASASQVGSGVNVGVGKACGIHRSQSVGFTMLGSVAGPWGLYGGNDFGLCLDANNTNLVVEGNHLEGNTNSNNVAVAQSQTEIIRDNVGFLTPCVTFTPLLSNASAAVPLSTAPNQPSQACYTVDGGNVTVWYDLYLGTDNQASQSVGSLNIPLPPGLAPGGGLPTQALSGFEDGITGSQINGRIGTLSAYYYGLVRAYDYMNRYPGGTGAHVVLNGTIRVNP